MTDLTDRLRALADDLHSKFGHNPMTSVMSEAAEEFLANRDRQGDQK